MSEIVIGGTFNHEISDKVNEIIKLVKSHTNLKIEFNYTDEETSYCQKINDKYIIYIKENSENIDDIIAHELMHVEQSELGITKLEIPENISDINSKLLNCLVNILFDYDANQQLAYKYNYIINSNHTQFNTWVSLVKQKINNISDEDIKYFAVNFFGIMILDSKNNCEKILHYTDKWTLEIRKIVYHLNDCFKLYEVGNNVFSCKTIYEASANLLGIL